MIVGIVGIVGSGRALRQARVPVSVSVKLVVAFNDDYAARRWPSLLADFAGFRCTMCTGVQLRG